MYPLECSDSYGVQGVSDSTDLAAWLNSWLRDEESTKCVLEKTGPVGAYIIPTPPKD